MESFRDYHLLNILEQHSNSSTPLDRLLCNYFRSNKALGSKDRKFISDTIYALVRWRGFLDHFCKHPLSWKNRYETYKQIDLYQQDEKIPIHIRASFPRWLFKKLEAQYGEATAFQICLDSNKPAPTTIRINSLKISRDSFYEKFKEVYPIEKCLSSQDGIIFKKKINFFILPEFKEGLFEIQDEGSQLVANMVNAKPGEHILDFCSGSGGKTLAFAPSMKESGQIYLHDIRAEALTEAKTRLKRAGIQNIQIILPTEEAKLTKLKNSMDCVLVDSPCSGTGTLRRNPDMKWKLTPENVKNLVEEQKKILKKAMTFLKPNGRLVYATCSILDEENEEQITFCQQELKLNCSKTFKSIPKNGAMDGFFAAELINFS